MADQSLEKVKESLERQIITVLDFLFTDNQITEDEIISISKDILGSLDVAQNKHNLYGSFYKLIRNYPALKPHLQKTFKHFKQPSYGY